MKEFPIHNHSFPAHSSSPYSRSRPARGDCQLVKVVSSSILSARHLGMNGEKGRSARSACQSGVFRRPPPGRPQACNAEPDAKRRRSASPARRRHRERERRSSRRFAAGSDSQIPARSIDGALGKRYHTARGLDEIQDRLISGTHCNARESQFQCRAVFSPLSFTELTP